MTEKEQRNYKNLTKTGKRLYKLGTINLKGDASKVRWLHPLGFLYNVIIGIIIPFYCMVTKEKMQEQYSQFFGGYTTLF